jgi:hypothetical protein
MLFQLPASAVDSTNAMEALMGESGVLNVKLEGRLLFIG